MSSTSGLLISSKTPTGNEVIREPPLTSNQGVICGKNGSKQSSLQT